MTYIANALHTSISNTKFIHFTGKTTLLYQVKLHETVTTVPTIGFNVESVSPCRGVNFRMWDVGGEDKSRDQWHYYYHNINGEYFCYGRNFLVTNKLVNVVN